MFESAVLGRGAWVHWVASIRGVGYAVYRDIAMPSAARNWTSTTQWTEWTSGLLHPISPILPATCNHCYGSVGYGYGLDGGPWPQCYHCGGYSWRGITFVPIAYSVDSGLESLLHRFKDWNSYRWARYALGSLLADFLIEHMSCLEAGRAIELATVVPSGNDARAWRPLQEVVEVIDNGWPVNWDLDVLTKVQAGRPERGDCDPSYYAAAEDRVDGRRVLLLDDTWTSGASTMSAAWALRDAGARSVVIVTLGRQLNRLGIGSSADLFTAATARPFDIRRCVLCG